MLFLIRLLHRVRVKKEAALPTEQQDAVDMLTVRDEPTVVPALAPRCQFNFMSVCKIGRDGRNDLGAPMPPRL